MDVDSRLASRGSLLRPPSSGHRAVDDIVSRRMSIAASPSELVFPAPHGRCCANRLSSSWCSGARSAGRGSPPATIKGAGGRAAVTGKLPATGTDTAAEEPRLSLVAGGGTAERPASCQHARTRALRLHLLPGYYPPPEMPIHPRPAAEPLERIRADLRWSGREDSNLRHPAPKNGGRDRRRLQRFVTA
jgi:hypothetical protein